MTRKSTIKSTRKSTRKSTIKNAPHKSDLVLLIEKLESNYDKCICENTRLKAKINRLLKFIKNLKKESKLLKKITNTTA